MVAHPLKDFVVRYKSGDLIYREGDQGSEMYIVQSGAVEIARSLAGKDHVVAVMEKGDFFGEMSILEGCPRTASARAVEDSELVEITSAVFDRMIRGNIEIAVRMLRKLSSRLQEANRKIEENLARPGSAVAVTPEAERVVPVASASKPTAPVRGRVAPLPEGVLGTLVLGEGEQVFPIRADVCLIGRYDPVTGTRPEIDLTAYDTNRSVSRRHAKLVARGNDWFLSEEVGALNGTFLNGKRLTPGKSEPVRSGDTLALGMVLLKFQGRTPAS
ncbi:MAG TPA: cyclic nucleotide-binding domain-containing protein [Candidatus Polarisedimenticolia bacterium]|nr:cyclic nucleotide-binding domain-containing protein [Candidatus Polarisedimenticolia bacterium]